MSNPRRLSKVWDRHFEAYDFPHKILLLFREASPSANQWGSRKYAFRKQMWKNHFIKCITRAVETQRLTPHVPSLPACVSIVSFRCLSLDEDNHVGGYKPLLDALKITGFIKDDNPRDISVQYLQVKCRRGRDFFAVEIGKYGQV